MISHRFPLVHKCLTILARDNELTVRADWVERLAPYINVDLYAFEAQLCRLTPDELGTLCSGSVEEQREVARRYGGMRSIDSFLNCVFDGKLTTVVFEGEDNELF